MENKKTIEELEHLLALEKERTKQFMDAFQVLEESLNNPYSYETLKHQMKMKSYKDIMSRDSKPIANLILNIGGLDFCEAVDLKKNGGCGPKYCTDCIHDYLEKTFSSTNQAWIIISDRYPSLEECHSNDNRFIVPDGQHRYQRLFDYENSCFIEPFYMGTVKTHVDKCVIAWQPFPSAAGVIEKVMENDKSEICGVTNCACCHCNSGPCESRIYK